MSLYLLALALMAQVPHPAVKTCEDGSVIRTFDKCPIAPGHRYEGHFAPKRERVLQQWTCAGADRPAWVETEQVQTPPGTRTRHVTTRLISAGVDGKRLPASMRQALQAEMDSFVDLYFVTPRCKERRVGGIVPILSLVGNVSDGGESKRRTREVELLPVAK